MRTLTAREGHIYTDAQHSFFSDIIYLGIYDSGNEYIEITIEQMNQIYI